MTIISMAYTIQEIVALCLVGKATIIGPSDTIINGVCDLISATSNQLSFFANLRYAEDFKRSKAGAIVLHPSSIPSHINSNSTYIVCDNPTEAFQTILDFFQGNQKKIYTGFQGIHPTAVIHPSATIHPSVHIGPYAVIDELVSIEENTVILAHSYIGRKSKIGALCLIHAHVVLREETIVEDYVIIQPGAVIGSCGFGYTTNNKGNHCKLVHWGNVVLKKDVEIGANSTIDRARFASTYIGSGTKIDNMVQIGHNVSIGKNCFLVSGVGIAGSSTIGDRVILAGKVGVNGHIDICSGVTVAACSGVTKSIKKPGVYSGIPVQPIHVHNKNAVLLRKIETLYDRVRTVEEKTGEKKQDK